MEREGMDSIEALLNAPYWIIDVLPMRVPEDSPGQFFAVEKYFLKEQLAAVRQKHVNLILKLNCYRDISADEWETVNPPPEQIAEAMRREPVMIMTGDSMFCSEPDELYMTLYHPDGGLLSLVRTLAAGEGLYVWEPGTENG